MQLALIGLGKMGWNLAMNCVRNGHEVVAYDISEYVREEARTTGLKVADSLDELVKKLTDRKIIWMMVPAGSAVDSLIAQLSPLVQKGDILIDGGNSNYKDTVLRCSKLKEDGIEYLDCGTSGGTDGALNGICAMIGGKKETFQFCEPLFQSISLANGYLYCGESGSGHFVKMVHNGIEYGMMQSIGEGFELLAHSGYDFDFSKIARVWNHGSVIRSWLMELTENAFSKDGNLEKIKGVVHSSGEGKWMVETALDMNVSTPVIALSLLMRYRSQKEDTFSAKLVAALRNEFGGHDVVGAEKKVL